MLVVGGTLCSFVALMALVMVLHALQVYAHVCWYSSISDFVMLSHVKWHHLSHASHWAAFDLIFLWHLLHLCVSSLGSESSMGGSCASSLSSGSSLVST